MLTNNVFKGLILFYYVVQISQYCHVARSSVVHKFTNIFIVDITADVIIDIDITAEIYLTFVVMDFKYPHLQRSYVLEGLFLL